MNLKKNIIGVILSGGKSVRMGQNKALLPFDGKPFIQHISEILQTVFTKVIVISNQKKDYEFLGLPIFIDIYKNCGPLGGIHTGLIQSSPHEIFVVSCDIPFITKELIEYIINFDPDADAKIPVVENKVHPLCSVYSQQCLPIIEKNLIEQNLKLQNVLTQFQTTFIPITPRLPFYKNELLSNINKWEEYRKIVI